MLCSIIDPMPEERADRKIYVPILPTTTNQFSPPPELAKEIWVTLCKVTHGDYAAVIVVGACSLRSD
jgi:hypothetical protein